jgi:hypothetical protein
MATAVKTVRRMSGRGPTFQVVGHANRTNAAVAARAA